MRFSLPSIKCSAVPPSFRLLRARDNQIKSFRQHSRKLGGAAEQSIDGSEKCALNFRVRMLLKGLERRSNLCGILS